MRGSMALCVWSLLALALQTACTSAASDSASGSDVGSTSASASTSTSTTLNTLTTSCNGGCSTNGACVVVGQSSENPITCVNNTDCVTLSSGQSALCTTAFDSNDSSWVFEPAEINDTAGAAPFERVGLLQLADQVTDLAFQKATAAEEPLSGPLELSSMNIQPGSTLDTVSFLNLNLSGMDSALALNSVKRIYINSCGLTSLPTAVVAGDSVTVISLANNAITTIPTDFQDESLDTLTILDLSNNELKNFDLDPDNVPELTTLYLRNNTLEIVPEVIFNLSSLQFLTLASNPIDASALSESQLEFLANLSLFTIDGPTNTTACPSTEVQDALNSSFNFCVGVDSDDDSASNSTIQEPSTTMPAATNNDDGSSSSNKTWLILGICLGVAVLLLVLLIIWCCYRRRRNEMPKLTNSTTPSIAIGMGDLADHPYMEFSMAPSNSSQTTSDFELLASVADGYIGLTRLSYDDVFLHKMLRVSSRSELWLGEYHNDPVLVKKIKSNTASKALLRDFVTEIELMFELKHPRIAAFRGAMWDADGTELCAVVEYVERGALRDCTVDTTVQLSVPKQHAIARQIADAMAFLHKQNIVHGRLSAFNILLDKDYSAKLSLFSIFHYVKLSPLDNECRIFVAPEVLRGEQPTERSDVYAFGVVLVEIDTGETPVMNAKRLALERSGRDSILSPTAAKTGFRLSRLCSGVMKETIAACLERDPMRRPSMADVAYALQTGAMKL